MWKEWTKTIKTFAEDITSPDFEDDDARGKEGAESDTEAADEAPYNRTARHTHGAGGPQTSSAAGAHGHDDDASLWLETPVRRLERNYDEPTTERRAAVKDVAHTSAQPSPVVGPTAAAPSPLTGGVQHFSEEQDGGDDVTSTHSEPERDAGARLRSPPLPPAQHPSPSSLPPVPTAALRGPPQAKATPKPLPQPAQQPQNERATESTWLTGNTATSSPSPSLSSSSAPAPKPVAAAAAPPQHSTLPSPSTRAGTDMPTSPSQLSVSSAVDAAQPQRQLEEQQRRISRLEGERTQLLEDIRGYQDEVRVAHEKTVAYYEAKLSTAHQEATDAAVVAAARTQEEVDSLGVALRTAASELERGEAERVELLLRIGQLEKEVEVLRGSVTAAAAQAEESSSAAPRNSDTTGGVPSLHTDAEWATLEATCEELRAALTRQEAQHQEATAASDRLAETAHESLVGQRDALQVELTAWRDRTAQSEEELTSAQERHAALQQHLEDEKQQRNATATAAAASAPPSAQAEQVALVERLTQQLQSAEAARRALEVQLQEAQSELMAALSCAKQQRPSTQQHDEAMDAVTAELQSTQRRVSELEHDLAVAHQQREQLTTQLAAEQAKGAAVQNSMDATSRAAGDEIADLTRKLQASTAQCGGLQAEVAKSKAALDHATQKLKSDALAHEKACAQLEDEHAEAEAALEDELAALRTQAVSEKKKLEEQLQKVRMEVQQTQKRLSQAEGERLAAETARSTAETRLQASEWQTKQTEEERGALQQQLQRCKAELAESQRAMKELADKAADSGAAISVVSLTAVKRELEEKLQTLEVTVEQVRRMTVDTLVRLGVDVPETLQESRRGAPSADSDARSKASRSSDDDEDSEDETASSHKSGARPQQPQQQQQRQLPLLQLFSLLTTECVQQHSIVLRAERVQQEWEQTYEQARQVNDSLNQQVADAWATIGKLREDLSVKDAATRQMQSRVGTGDARLLELQEELTRVAGEAQQLREEREGWERRLQQAEVGAEGQEHTVASLQEELQSAQSLLLMKEEEVQSAQQSLENLQMVLDRFQDTKRQEVASLTLEAHMEADALKEELAEVRRGAEQHEQAKAAVRQAYEMQLAAKDAEVTTLHRKLAEVRKVLERTTSRHMDGTETSVDKRVVSQLLAKYIHAFIGQRKEAGDMLKVLSGLLDWDEATQEMAGLLPGPNNPHPPGSGPAGQQQQHGGSGGGRTGLFGWRRKKDDTTQGAPRSSGGSGGGAGGANKSGLASMWVEFLLKESEGAATASGAATSPAASANAAAPRSMEASATSPTSPATSGQQTGDAGAAA